MYNQPYFIPGYNTILPASLKPATRRIPFSIRIGNIFNNFKTFNWTELINNTSKTLGIINQTIPVVKQVGPMFGNMKSMIKLASIFKDETDTIQNNQQKKEPLVINNDDSPTFFIN